MIAVDTNVVVRLITADHPDQSPRALALFTQHEIWLPTSVVLETESVLRSSRGFTRAQFVDALGLLAGLPNLRLEHPARIAQALDWHGQGMDFADAIHLAASDECKTFATFDRRLIAAAGQPEIGRPVREP